MRRIIITTAVAVLVIASSIVPALAGEPDGPVHIALGDSVAAGSGANNSNTTYVARLNRYLHAADCSVGQASACPHLQLVDYSAGGAKSEDLIATQLDPALASIEARQTDSNPNNNVEYITITIGGNDLFQPVIDACSGSVDEGCAYTIATLLSSYGANLTHILGTLRHAAPDAEIAIMTYYNPLGACELSEFAPLADFVLEGGGGVPIGLNEIIRVVADGVGGITVVETSGLLDPRDFVGGTDCLHPDDGGHRKIAKAFRSAMS